MRITEQTRTTALLRGIDLQSSAMNLLNQQLATGRKVNEPSDDPVATGNILRTNAYIAGLNENLSVVNSAQSFSQAAGDALSDSTSVLSQVQTLAVQGANGTQSATDLQAIGGQVNQLLESLVQDSNAQFNGRYLFSGTRTDTGPVAVARDGQGNIQSISYRGSANNLAFPIGQGQTAAASVTARAAYMDSGVLSAVKQFRDDLNNAQGLSSQAQQQALSNDLGAIGAAQNAFLAQAAEVGSYQSQFTSLSQQMQTSLTQAQTILSNFQDADIAQVGVQLQIAQNLYQAVLSSGAKLLGQNDLFSYL